MPVARYRYLKICGDIAKHNLARLETNVAHIRKLLKDSGHEVSEQDAYLAVDDFFEWFHSHIFMYQSSVIGEFLNNIRWAIYDYLQPEFRRAFHYTGELVTALRMYSFHVPSDIRQPVAHAMYWDLMNRSRTQPYVHRFVISDNCKSEI